MPMYLASDLLAEIEIAKWCLENHHVNCEWETWPDLEAEETESCAEFAEQFGKSYDRLTCFDHDKLREWTKLKEDNLQSFLFLPERTMPACGQNGEVWFIQGRMAYHKNCVACALLMTKDDMEHEKEFAKMRKEFAKIRKYRGTKESN